MNRSLITLSLILFIFLTAPQAQTRRKSVLAGKPSIPKTSAETIRTAVVVDERLAVLRQQPNLSATPVQRMRRGRLLTVNGSRLTDGILFYRVNVPPDNFGWVQAEAVVAKNRKGDEERLFRLIQASEGFDRIERAILFLENFPVSPLRPPILLLLGDLAEENAVKLSTEAARRLDQREMAATGAPIHSFYLNYSGLDRFLRTGVNFLFNPSTRKFHYDGAAWREITAKFPTSTEASEAAKRLESLNLKMRESAKK